MRAEDVLNRACGGTLVGVIPFLFGGGAYGALSGIVPMLWAVAAAATVAVMALTVTGGALFFVAVTSLPSLTDD